MWKTPLHRRTLLRGMLGGAALGIALPPLEAFFNATGAAYAADGSFPNRFGLFFWGNGVLPERWIPRTTGANWEISEQLMPLESVRDVITVISGMEVKTPNRLSHISGPAGLLSGADLQMYSAEDYTFTQPTLDQVLAAEIGGDTRFRSLEVGVSPGAVGLSYNGPDSMNPAESDVVALFERLFGGSFRAPGDEPIFDPKLALRRSLLDGVMADAERLKKRLGATDIQRLDQHLSGIRDLERSIARLEADPPNLASCSRPTAPDPLPNIDGRPQMTERSKVISDLVAMAFACDQTRVLSCWYTDPVSDVLFGDTSAGHHQLTHDEPGDQPQVNQIVQSVMADLAGFIERLRSIPEGDGTLLDHSTILATTDVSYGRTHMISEYPIILAGGNGRFQTGIHHRYEFSESASRVSLSLLRAMGLPAASFGEDDAYTDQGLSEIEL
jgi:hypothetical protein